MRKVEEIKQEILDDIAANPHLQNKLTSTSATAVYRNLAGVVAYSIFVFENLHELFRQEMRELAEREKPGRIPWFVERLGDDWTPDIEEI